MQRWCFSRIPLTGFVPCVKPKQGTSKEILSLFCPTSVDSNMQMTFHKINRDQGLALGTWQWHPKQDHGKRGQIQRKHAVLGFPVSAASLWLLDGRRGGSGTVCMQDLQTPSIIALNRLENIWGRAKMGKRFAGVQNVGEWMQELPDLSKIMEFY